MILDIGGLLFEAIKNSNATELTMPQFVNIVKGWYETHHRPVDSDQIKGFEEAFMKIDTDNSKTISRKEIFKFMFDYMDLNGDGVWN